MTADTIATHDCSVKASQGTGGPRIAKVNYFAGQTALAEHGDIGEGEANARLIAAAPELLAALREMTLLEFRWRHECRHSLSEEQWKAASRASDRADSAIAKAGGAA